MKERVIFIFHILIIFLVGSSPFWVNYKFIFIFILAYYLQIFIFGNCLLTIKQFNSNKRETSVYSFILKKLGFKINQKNVANFVDFIMPWIILGIALIWQLF